MKTIPMAMAAAIAALTGLPAVAQAQDAVAEFYQGRTIQLQVGSSAGSGYDVVGRLVARYMGQYIPGNPTIIVENIPGTGSLPLANEFANVTPRDGSVIGLVNNGVPATPLLMPETVRFDPREFHFLGTTDIEKQVMVVWETADVEELDDVFENEVIVGAGAPGSAMFDIPLLTNALLDTQFRIIRGYAGTPEVKLAMEIGEVEANAAMNWGSARTMFAPELANGTARVIAQYGSTPHPELPDVPLFPMGETEEERQIFELVLARQEYGRPFITPPGVPEDRLAALREAFEATMRDEDFLAEAAAYDIDINPVSWQALEELTERIFETPPEVVERVRVLLADN